MRSLLVLGLLAACGRSTAPILPPGADQLALQAAYAAAADSVPHQGSGWPSDTDCDGALWAGEARAAGLHAVDPTAALQPDGRPTRRPGRDCGPAESPATTSTDMQLGTIEGLLAAGDLAALEALQGYVDSHSDFAGFPADAAHAPYTLMKPGTRTLLARAIRHLGGKPSGVWADLPLVNSPTGQDFEVHLAVVLLATERQTGSWSADDELAATNLCAANPSDAAVQAVCGHEPAAEALILAPGWTPPGYVRGAPGYAAVHKAWILHYLLTSGQLDR